MLRAPLLTDYRQDLRMFPDRWSKLAAVAVLGVALYFPFTAGDHWLGIATSALVAVVGATALMMLTGFAGQISLGHAAFLAVGAYTVAILGERWGVPFWIALPAAGFVAALVGLLIGPFALRLEGLYLAIVTIGLLYLVGHVLLSFPKYTHGHSGIAVGMHTWFAGAKARASFGDFWDPTTIWGIRLRYEQKLYLVFLVVAVITGLVAKNLKRSNIGRAMFAVRDHDLAAAVLGVHPAKTKIIAFGLSSFFAGVAGGMLAYKATYITVSPPFDLAMSIDYIAMIVLGGIGTVFGAVVGALVYVMLHPFAEKLGGWIGLGKYVSSTEQQATLIFALIVIGFLIFEPFGLAGIWRRIKRYFQGWPFRY